MDWATAEGAEIGRVLKGFGLNLLVRDTAASAQFLKDVLTCQIIRQDADFALLRVGGQLVQLHADATYHDNPLPSLLPELGARGAGIELRLFEIDPDAAEARARNLGYTVFRASLDRGHGLRECYLLDPDGYCWVPSRPL